MKIKQMSIISGVIIILLGVAIGINNKRVDQGNIKRTVSVGNFDALVDEVLSDEVIKKRALEENSEIITFLANTFVIDKDILLDRLINSDFNIENQSPEDFTRNLIDFLINLEKSEKGLFNSQIKANSDSKEYIVALIKYFTTIYPDVDFTIAAAIAQVESNYTSKSMMQVNNIYGGLVKGKLLKYRNIEYGVLKYIKLLNDGYFNKGLTTIETIGKVYNPTYTENGTKIASPTWVKNVHNATSKYMGYEEDIDIAILNSLKSIA